MDYQKIRQQLENLKQIYERICNDVELNIEERATEEEVKRVEEKIGMSLPKQLRNFFLYFSKECMFDAYLPDEFELPEGLREIFCASFRIALDEVVHAADSGIGWLDCFTDEEDEYDRVWYNKLGMMTVPNGDVIALDIGADKENPPVVYLSHDGGDGHGYILGNTFEEYFESLLAVGACGNEDWQMLPFCLDERSGIVPDCENAVTYRKLIGMNE